MYEPGVCNGCYDISMIAFGLKNIAILNMQDVDYGCVIWDMSKSNAINRLNNS